jgi:5-methyltetrahydrofolate--homocysteine methyltransferase
MLRQQEAVADSKAHLSLADFVAAESAGVSDYVGAFAVTAGLGLDALVQGFERAHDDYSAIVAKALADRLAEAFAAFLHARARREWTNEQGVTPEDIVAERHRGIRPGFGYPACPDHSEQAGRAGIELTEHAAMMPAASVSGLYLAHESARYFSVGRVGEDQVADYARRKGMAIDEVERWLAPVLAYEVARA